MRNDRGSGQVNSSGSGDQWLRSGSISKVEPIRLGDRLIVGHEKERGIKADASIFGPEQWEAWCYSWQDGED